MSGKKCVPMSKSFCFTLFGKKICIPLYYVDPWRRRPGPDPPLQMERIKSEMRQDVARLASMRVIALGLTHNQGRPIIAVLDAGLAKINKKLLSVYQLENKIRH